MGTGRTSLTYVLGSTGGRSTKIQYSTNNSSWVDIESKSANGTYSTTIPSLLTSYPNTATPTIYFRATNTGGTASTSKSSTIDSNIKPTMNSVALTSSTSYSVLNGKFVRLLTKPVITSSASGSNGSTISSYKLTALTGYSGATLPKTIAWQHNESQAFQKAGTATATVMATDSRGRTASKTSSNVSVIDYSYPTISSWSVQRCKPNGTPDEQGTNCLLKINYNVSPINDGTNNLNSFKVYYSLDGSTYREITTSAWNGTITEIITDEFDTAISYPIHIRLTDISTTINYNTILTSSKVLVSKHAGGEGITFGRVAEEDGFHEYLGAHFHNNIYIDIDNVETSIEVVDTW